MICCNVLEEWRFKLQELADKEKQEYPNKKLQLLKRGMSLSFGFVIKALLQGRNFYILLSSTFEVKI